MDYIDYDEVVIKYKSAKEIKDRQISSISSRINLKGKMYISAYCHLRGQARSFVLDNIIELHVNGSPVDKKEFWYNNIVDKEKFNEDLFTLSLRLDNDFLNYNEFEGTRGFAFSSYGYYKKRLDRLGIDIDKLNEIIPSIFPHKV